LRLEASQKVKAILAAHKIKNPIMRQVNNRIDVI
jgi:hypothetical protein